MAPNQNSVAVNSSNDDGSTLVNRSNRIIVSILVDLETLAP